MMEERARRDAVQEKQMRLLTEQMRSLQTWMSSIGVGRCFDLGGDIF